MTVIYIYIYIRIHICKDMYVCMTTMGTLSGKRLRTAVIRNTRLAKPEPKSRKLVLGSCGNEPSYSGVSKK